jgi:indolepyruvate ferredoxin oxidoreductase alpha subunit
MKHVGLNVAMDPFVNSALVAIRGGLVVAVADDPGMHSSQNEQDSRILARFARVPCLEPATQQEAYDMTRTAFRWSEAHGVPVVVRLVTRLCHGRAEIRRAPAEEPSSPPAADPRDWILLPAHARRLRARLLDEEEAVTGTIRNSRWLVRSEGGDHRRVSVVTAGIARGYVDEILGSHGLSLRRLHVGAHPVPEEVIRWAARDVDELLVVEEGDAVLEDRIRGILPSATATVRGRGTGDVPATGELTPASVRAALGFPALAERSSGLALPGRPPQLCRGCPHRDAFHALNAVLEGEAEAVVAGDIGCYTLGALPPFGSIHSCVCMGASVGMAKGAADAGRMPAVAVIGDSTFLHSGIPALVDAAAHDTDMTVLVLDNGTVAMTGQQPTVLPGSRIEALVRAVGVGPGNLRVVETHPRRLHELEEALRAALAHPGLSVVIARRECIESARKRKGNRRQARRSGPSSSERPGEAAPADAHAGAPSPTGREP